MHTSLKTTKVETLAKLYLESPPAEISNTMLNQLRDWLWDELQSIPTDIQFSWYRRYENADEMFADIQKTHRWVSGKNYDPILDINSVLNFILQAVCNDDHYYTNSNFSLAGEIAAYNATSKRAPNLSIQKIIYSETVLRPAAHVFLGYAPISKIVFL
jgi:hypothetical protein